MERKGEDGRPVLSILIPVYNEEASILTLCARLFNVPWAFTVEFIFVNDGSTDNTLSILKSIEAKNQSVFVSRGWAFRIVDQQPNAGKGAALRTAIAHSSGEYCITQDADLEYDPGQIPDLLNYMIEAKLDVVYGNRFAKGRLPNQPPLHYFANRILTLLSNLVSGYRVSDMETCYKVFRGDLLRKLELRSNRFGIEVELTAHAAALNLSFGELPIAYSPRTYLQGKKIGWRDGLAALVHILHFNWFWAGPRTQTLIPKSKTKSAA